MKKRIRDYLIAYGLFAAAPFLLLCLALGCYWHHRQTV